MHFRAAHILTGVAIAVALAVLVSLLSLDAATLLILLALATVAAIFISFVEAREFLMLRVVAVLFLVAISFAIFVATLSLIGPALIMLITLALFAIVATLTARRNERQRRQWAVAGYCEICGYDLRETPDICPECGSPIPEELARRRRIAAVLSGRKTPEEAAREVMHSE